MAGRTPLVQQLLPARRIHPPRGVVEKRALEVPGQSCAAAVYGRRMNIGRVANLIVQLLLSLWTIGFVLGLLPGGSDNPWVVMAFLVGTIAFFWISARFHQGEEW